MVEHLGEVAAFHSSAARRTPIKMILFGQIAHAMANVLPARELDNPAVLFSHLVCADTARPRPKASKGGVSGARV